MSRKLNVLYGILACLLIILIKHFEVYEAIAITGNTWSFFNGAFNVLSVIALLCIAFFSIYFIFAAFKSIFTEDD